MIREINIDGKNIEPLVVWGTSPQDVSPVTGVVPDPENEKNEDRKIAMKRSLDYMGLKANTKISDIKIDKIFIGSCTTNGRIEDLRLAADLLKGKKIAENVSAMVVPGSGLVKEQAEKEGIDKIFKDAGFEWREPLLYVLGMNPDQLKPKERCASTSNRNFEGRQGRGGRTHLVSPGMAIAAAFKGHFNGRKRNLEWKNLII